MSLSSFIDHLLQSSLSIYRAGRGRQVSLQSSESWQTFPEKVKEEACCVFVLSTGRCGTRLLTQVLRKTGNIDVNHHAEIAPELQYPTKLAYEVAGLTDVQMDLIASCSRFEPIQTSFLNDRVFAETNNRITFLAPYLAKIFQNSRFIHLVRNPVGFVRSGVSAGFYEGGYYDIGRISPKDEPKRGEFDEYSQVKKVAWLWNETNHFIEEFKNSINPSRIMTVQSEQIFKDEKTLEGIIDFSWGKQLSTSTLRRLVSKKVNTGRSFGLPSALEAWPEVDQQALREECLLAESYGYALEERCSPHVQVDQSVALAGKESQLIATTS